MSDIVCHYVLTLYRIILLCLFMYNKLKISLYEI